jgi:Rod binding domain-containing protein
MRIDALTPIEATATSSSAAPTPEVDPKLRSAALQFEELLVRQLTQVLAETAKGDDDEGGDATASFYANQLPDVLASAIKDAGGLGLATELERAMRTETRS